MIRNSPTTITYVKKVGKIGKMWYACARESGFGTHHVFMHLDWVILTAHVHVPCAAGVRSLWFTISFTLGYFLVFGKNHDEMRHTITKKNTAP